MRKLRPINLPQDHPSDYARRLSVMLYQYLRDVVLQVNETIDVVDEEGFGLAFAPLSTGVEPLELVSDGQGQCVMVPYRQ